MLSIVIKWSDIMGNERVNTNHIQNIHKGLIIVIIYLYEIIGLSI